MIRTNSLFRLAGAGLLSGMLFALPAFAEPVELRIATLMPAGSPGMRAMEQTASSIKDKTAGRVTFRYYEGGQQGDERDFIRKINLGQLDGAVVTGVGLSMIDESIRVLEAPGLFESVEELDYVADKMWPYFQKKFETKGYKLMDRGEVGWVYFLSKDRVETVAALKGIKLWLWGDDAMMGALYKKIGLNGVPLGMPEVEPSLTTGRITGCYGSPLTAVALQWHTKVKFMNSSPVNFGIGATVFSLRSLRGLSTEDLKAVESVSSAGAKKLRKQIRKANEDAETTMTRRGVTIVAPADSMVREMAAFSAAARQELAGKVYSQSELDTAIRYREEFRHKHKPSPAK